MGQVVLILYLIFSVVKSIQNIVINSNQQKKQFLHFTGIHQSLTESKSLTVSQFNCSIGPIGSLQSSMIGLHIQSQCQKDIEEQHSNFIDQIILCYLHYLASTNFKHFNQLEHSLSSITQTIKLKLCLRVMNKQSIVKRNQLLVEIKQQVKNYLNKVYNDQWMEKQKDHKNKGIEKQNYENDRNNKEQKQLKVIGRILETTPIDNSIEYIKNNRFSNTTCVDSNCIWNISNFQPHYINSWNPDPQIKIARANTVVALIRTSYVVVLTALKSTCIWQLVSNLPRGLFQLNYEYLASLSLSQLVLGKINVYINQSLVHVTQPKNHSHSFESISDIPITQDHSSIKLKFCNKQTPGIHGTVLLLVSFKRYSDLPQPNQPQIIQNTPENNFESTSENNNQITSDLPASSQNTTQETLNSPETTSIDSSIEYIKNNRFRNTTCVDVCCIWSISNFLPNYLDSWNPDPQIQLGQMRLYTSLPNSDYVVQLTAFKPSCIWQQVRNLPTGLFQVKYQYAVNPNVQLVNGKIHVYINDVLIHVTSANNYSLSWDYIRNIEITQNDTSIKLKLCNQQTTSSFGTILTVVSLKKVNDLPQTYQNQIIQNTQTYDSSIDQLNTQNNTETNNLTSPQYIQNNSSDILLYNHLEVRQTLRAKIQVLNFIFQLIFKENSSQLLIANPSQATAIRTVFRPYFSFLVNLDHMWLYIYHQRQYSNFLVQIFNVIRNFQETKWDFVQNFIQDNFGKTINFQPIQYSLNKKISTTPVQFLIIENTSRQFLSNNFKFFLVNIPLVICIFLSCRGVHYFFYKIFRKLIFKQFAFKSYLILMLLEGNSQPFTYFLFSDILTIGSHEIRMKLTGLSSILFLFLLLMLLISIPFILRSKYEKQHKVYYYDKSKNSLPGAAYFMVDFGLYNMLLGSAHLLLQNKPDLQLLTLSCIETVYIAFTIYNLRKNKLIYLSKLTIWIGFFASLLRINFMLISFLFSKSQGNLKQIVDQVMAILVISYLIFSIISLLQVFLQILYEALSYFMMKMKKLILRKSKSINKIANLMPIQMIDSKCKQKEITIIHDYEDREPSLKHPSTKNVNLYKQQLIFQHRLKLKSLPQPKVINTIQLDVQNTLKISNVSQFNQNNVKIAFPIKIRYKLSSHFGENKKTKMGKIKLKQTN